MTQVIRQQGESIEGLMRRFKGAVQEDDILGICRQRRFYEKPSQARKRKAAAKLRKSRRAARKSQDEQG